MSGGLGRRDAADLLLLSALWGASFLFMRLGAHDFGAFALVFVRVAGAALLLLPILALRGNAAALRSHWKPIALVGIVNSALPFLGFVIAAYVLSAGLMSIFNATSPIWGALVAWVWLDERPAGWRALGLLVGLAGAVALAWNEADLRTEAGGISAVTGIAACLAAAVLYGIGANLARRHLVGVPPLTVAAGSQLAAAALLLLPAWLWWPTAPLSLAAWASAAMLAFACTGLAYVLYFRLIARAGTTPAMTVTFLIPGFAMLWGWLALDEQPTRQMLIGCAVILLGTALASGWWQPGRSRRAPGR